MVDLKLYSSVSFPGPLRVKFRTRDCDSVADVRAIWRLSWKSYLNMDSRQSDAGYVRSDPDKTFRHIAGEHISNPYDYAMRVAEANEWMGRSSVVSIAIDRLTDRRDIHKAFRLAEKYERCGRYVDRAIRLVRKWEDAGLVCDDYAAVLDSAISELVNRRY